MVEIVGRRAEARLEIAEFVPGGDVFDAGASRRHGLADVRPFRAERRDPCHACHHHTTHQHIPPLTDMTCRVR